MKFPAVWHMQVARGAVACFVSSAVLAGCGGDVQRPPSAAPAETAARVRSEAWMSRDASSRSILVYAGDWSTNDVDVYDYPSGTQVGTLTGFSEPYGGCVDADGDVYITNYLNGTAVEYGHGGTAILNTYTPGGEPIGCSVDKHGDVAITNYSPGEVTVYAGGNSSDGKSYSSEFCTTQWPMGYDDHGNLIGEGENRPSSFNICELRAGTKKERFLDTMGISIEAPGGVMWDGKYIALAQHRNSRSQKTVIAEATLNGAMLTGSGYVAMSSQCGFVDDVDPFILGKKNTPVNNQQGAVIVGTTPGCSGSAPGISFWHYPKGGKPYSSFGTSSALHSVSAVSIK